MLILKLMRHRVRKLLPVRIFFIYFLAKNWKKMIFPQNCRKKIFKRERSKQHVECTCDNDWKTGNVTIQKKPGPASTEVEHLLRNLATAIEESCCDTTTV